MTFTIQHGSRGHLSLSNDQELPADMLPRGRVPIWLQRTEEVTDVQILEKVKEYHVHSDETVTVMYEKHNDDVKTWCEEQGWRNPEVPADDRVRKWRYLDRNTVYGIEDMVAIIISDIVDTEAISMARNMVVMVTTRGR